MIALGDILFKKLFLGDSPVKKAFFGDVQVYPNGAVPDVFYMQAPSGFVLHTSQCDSNMLNYYDNTYEYSLDDKLTWTDFSDLGVVNQETISVYDYAQENPNKCLIVVDKETYENRWEYEGKRLYGRVQEYDFNWKELKPKFYGWYNNSRGGYAEVYYFEYEVDSSYTNINMSVGFGEDTESVWEVITYDFPLNGENLIEYYNEESGILVQTSISQELSAEEDVLYWNDLEVPENTKLYIRVKEDYEEGTLVNRQYPVDDPISLHSIFNLTMHNINEPLTIGGILDYLLTNNPDGYSYNGSTFARAFTFDQNDSRIILDAQNLILNTNVPNNGYRGMFVGKDLLHTPAMNFDSVSNYGCAQMYHYCHKLQELPEINANDVYYRGFNEIFYGATLDTGCEYNVGDINITNPVHGGYVFQYAYRNCNLKTTPELNFSVGTSIYIDYVCGSMFRDSRIEEIKNLPSGQCVGYFSSMFYDCDYLTTVPVDLLKGYEGDTINKSHMFSGMFNSCSNLENAPIIYPETIDAGYVFDSMFRNCTSLTECDIRVKNVTGSPSNIFQYMFYGDTSLNKIATYITRYSSGWFVSWVYGVAQEGEFFNNGRANFTRGSNGIPINWLRRDPVTITYVSEFEQPEPKTVQYGHVLTSEDLPILTHTGYKMTGWDKSVGDVITEDTTITATWKEYLPLTFIAEQANSTVRYNAYTGTTAEYSLDGGSTWTNAVNVTVTLQNVGDSVMYKGKLLDNFTGSTQSARFSMTGLVAAYGSIMSMYNENSDDTVITKPNAFICMFSRCGSLTTAPQLPATTISKGCYESMLEYTGITTMPDLPAETLEESCYSRITRYCTNLINAKPLIALNVPQWAYNYIYQGCTSLVNGPEIYATSMEGAQPLYKMFDGCSSLTSVTHHITDWSTSNAQYWLSDVAATGTVYCPADSTIPSDSPSGIPRGWSRVDI